MNGISNTSGGVIGVNCSKPAPGSSSSLVERRRRGLSDQQYFSQYGNATSLPKMRGRSSAYKGVTRHRWTGRFEAHLWDKEGSPAMRPKKGKQVYLGAYDDEETAARTYDLAALKYWGQSATLNFPISYYEKELKEMKEQTREEYIGSLRRKSSGFSRGVSKYRGVARHHKNGRWEARMGRVYGNKYLYLGTYATQEEAATAYDLAAIQFRGLNAITNFDRSRYYAPLNNNNFTNHIPLPLPTGASEEEEIMKNSTDAIDQTAATAGDYQCGYYGTTSFEVDHHHHNGLVSQSMGWVESEVQRDENRLGCAQGLDVDWDFDEEFFMEISSILRDFEDLDDADIN